MLSYSIERKERQLCPEGHCLALQSENDIVMNETPVGRDKRPLESPGTPSPIHKQSKMAVKDSNTSELHSFSSSDNMSAGGKNEQNDGNHAFCKKGPRKPTENI